MLFWWLAAFFIIIFYGLIILRIIAFFSKDPQKVFYLGKQQWARIMIWLAGVKLSLEGLPNIEREQAYIFAANHASIFDIVLLMAAVPIYFAFVMDEKLFRVPFGGRYAALSGDLPISRRDPQKAGQYLVAILNKIKDNKSVLFFPEGTRSRDGSLGEFKKGIGMLALQSNVPVIPVALAGSFNIIPRGSLVIHPRFVKIKFGQPMKFDPQESEGEIAVKIHDQVASLLG